MTRIVVCDTGPLLHLSEAGAIHLLQHAGEILTPPVVASEFEANAQGWRPPHWVKVVDLDTRSNKQAVGWIQDGLIDQGEAEAIGLALQINADWFLTDDAKARQFAESLGLEVHGSIGLLLWNAAVGNLDDRAQAMTLLNQFARTSLWVQSESYARRRKPLICCYRNRRATETRLLLKKQDPKGFKNL